MPTAIARLIAGITVATLIACGNPPPANTVTSVTIDGGDRAIVLGDTPTLTATVEVTGNASTTVNWTSSNQTVATIAADGQVTSLTTGTTDITASSTVDATKSGAITLTINPPGALRWTRQFGTSNDDEANGIATDASGNVTTTGYTEGDLEGSNAGGSDAFVRSYDSDGNLRWTRQFGTGSSDFALGIASDANGHIYTAGYTLGSLEGSSAGGWDAFIRSYDSDGNLRWTRQFGTSSTDNARGIDGDDSGNV